MRNESQQTYFKLALRDYRWLDSTEDAIDPVLVDQAIWRIKHYLCRAHANATDLLPKRDVSEEFVEKKLADNAARLKQINENFNLRH